MAHSKKYIVNQRIQMVWFFIPKQNQFYPSDKVCETLTLDRKHGKPSKTNHPSCGNLTSFWKMGLWWMYLTVEDRNWEINA